VRAASAEFTILSGQTGLNSASVRGWIGLYLVEAISNVAGGRKPGLAHWRALRTTLQAVMLKNLVDHGLIVQRGGALTAASSRLSTTYAVLAQTAHPAIVSAATGVMTQFERSFVLHDQRRWSPRAIQTRLRRGRVDGERTAETREGQDDLAAWIDKLNDLIARGPWIP
jgi:hypothetical protein